jgi:hypothetical protein
MNQKKQIIDKKILLIQVLKKLESHWDLAPGILALIQSSYVDEKVIDGVLTIISKSIKSIKKQEQKQKIQKWLEKIQQIKDMESNDQISEEKLDQLLSDI